MQPHHELVLAVDAHHPVGGQLPVAHAQLTHTLVHALARGEEERHAPPPRRVHLQHE